MNLNHMDGNGHSLEESEDINLGASERNPMSARNGYRDGYMNQHDQRTMHEPKQGFQD